MTENTKAYTRLRPGEANQIQILIGLIEAFRDAQKVLKDRLKLCGMWRQVRIMDTWCTNLEGKLMGTIDPHRRALFNANLANQEIRVVNKTSVSGIPDMVLCREDDLRYLISLALHDHCAICMGHGTDMRGCSLRKCLKGMTMFDLDESGGVCMGKQIEPDEMEAER